jgi:hypothetical protein
MGYRHLFSWIALAISIGLLACAVYGASMIREEAALHAERAAGQEQLADRSIRAERMSAILLDTVEERAQLESLARLDVVALVELLEATARSAGIEATVASADAQEGTELPGGEQLQPIAVAINGSGSYAALMHAIELYEHLPLAIQIDQIDMARDQSSTTEGAWSLALRLRILTITPLL